MFRTRLWPRTNSFERGFRQLRFNTCYRSAMYVAVLCEERRLRGSHTRVSGVIFIALPLPECGLTWSHMCEIIGNRVKPRIFIGDDGERSPTNLQFASIHFSNVLTSIRIPQPANPCGLHEVQISNAPNPSLDTTPNACNMWNQRSSSFRVCIGNC